MEAQKKPARSRKRRSKTSEFVQDFLPVREIRNGIIETTDDRYVKIIEILPINFLLRSSEEQYNIISSFASWLKISPMKLQFKSVSRKADSDKHVAMVREELSREENQQCRQLGEEYLRLIKDVVPYLPVRAPGGQAQQRRELCGYLRHDPDGGTECQDLFHAVRQRHCAARG